MSVLHGCSDVDKAVWYQQLGGLIMGYGPHGMFLFKPATGT
jgi:hypothetical protein